MVFFSYICSQINIMRANYGKPLREMFMNNRIQVDRDHLQISETKPVFEDATTYPSDINAYEKEQ